VYIYRHAVFVNIAYVSVDFGRLTVSRC